MTPKMATDKVKRKIVGYLLTPHIEECCLFNGRNDSHFPWCLPEAENVTPKGHKHSKYLYVFRCNDTQCTARLGISARDYHNIHADALAHLRPKGAPKRKRKTPCPTK